MLDMIVDESAAQYSAVKSYTTQYNPIHCAVQIAIHISIELGSDKITLSLLTNEYQ